MVSLQLEGRTVVVTGAGQGQGAAEARMLVESGARVIATDRAVDMPAELAAVSSPSACALVYRQLYVSDASGCPIRTWWGGHTVRIHSTGIKHIHHPVVGDVSLRYEPSAKHRLPLWYS